MGSDVWTVFERYEREARVALGAVRMGAGVCRAVQMEGVKEAGAKADRSPVTVADFAGQAVVARTLRQAFPQDPLVAEEDSAWLSLPENAETLQTVTRFAARAISEATPRSVCRWVDYGQGETGSRFWTLDPLDGTKGFLRGGQYVVALGLIEDGEVVLGALACPVLGRNLRPSPRGDGIALIAVKGLGAWIGPIRGDPKRRVHVSKRRDVRKARMLTSYDPEHTDPAKIKSLVQSLGMEAAPIRMDSQAKFAVLSGGGAEMIVRVPSPLRPGRRDRIWDFAAGTILVEQAGGRVTDLQGKPLELASGREMKGNLGVLATNGRVHDALLEAIAALGIVGGAEPR